MLPRLLLPAVAWFFLPVIRTLASRPDLAATQSRAPKNIILLIGDGMARPRFRPVCTGKVWENLFGSVSPPLAFTKAMPTTNASPILPPAPRPLPAAIKHSTAPSACSPDYSPCQTILEDLTPAAGPPAWWLPARLPMPHRPVSSPIRICGPLPKPSPKITWTRLSIVLSAAEKGILTTGPTKKTCWTPWPIAAM
jgi:hypothetical protein